MRGGNIWRFRLGCLDSRGLRRGGGVGKLKVGGFSSRRGLGFVEIFFGDCCV